MDIQFYNVKKRAKVTLPASSVKKVKFERTTKNGKHQTRYAVQASDPDDGMKLTKFVKKEFWEDLDAPMA